MKSRILALALFGLFVTGGLPLLVGCPGLDLSGLSGLIDEFLGGLTANGDDLNGNDNADDGLDDDDDSGDDDDLDDFDDGDGDGDGLDDDGGDDDEP